MKEKYSKKYIIDTSKGLQEVDGLKTSTYFEKESKKYINGEITFEELKRLIEEYYQNKSDKNHKEEIADIVSIRISELLHDDSFTFSIGQLKAIHKYLFSGLLDDAGEFRKYNISKREWALNGASVYYGDYHELVMAVDYDLTNEKNFSYSGLSQQEMIDHISLFIANLWQIHPFTEGNTRTNTVFLIKYLRKMGFNLQNDTFEKNSWYFRNALVRANYCDVNSGVFEDRTFLNKFLRNLLLGEHNHLLNRELNISFIPNEKNMDKKDKIISLIELNNKITIKELAKELNVSIRTMKSTMSRLQDSGLIVRINGKRYGYWKIIKN